jgi:hypothetical protein
MRKRGGTFNEEQLKFCAFQMIRGLAYMHSMGFFHLDFKTSNVLYSKNGDEFMITDFGISTGYITRYSNQDPICTPSFRPPEIFLGQKSISKKIDVWSCAATMYHLLTNEFITGPDFNISDKRYVKNLFKVLVFPKKDDPPKLSGEMWENIKSDLRINTSPNWGAELKDILAPNPLLKDLLSKMLKIDPDERCTIFEAYEHPYFDSLRNQNVAGLIGPERYIDPFDNVDRMVNVTNYLSMVRADISPENMQTKKFMDDLNTYIVAMIYDFFKLQDTISMSKSFQICVQAIRIWVQFLSTTPVTSTEKMRKCRRLCIMIANDFFDETEIGISDLLGKSLKHGLMICEILEALDFDVIKPTFYDLVLMELRRYLSLGTISIDVFNQMLRLATSFGHHLSTDYRMYVINPIISANAIISILIAILGVEIVYDRLYDDSIIPMFKDIIIKAVEIDKDGEFARRWHPKEHSLTLEWANN